MHRLFLNKAFLSPLYICRTIYEGSKCLYLLKDCQSTEECVHIFRVAAVNDVGKGPYSLPVSLAKTKACVFLPPLPLSFPSPISLPSPSLPSLSPSFLPSPPSPPSPLPLVPPSPLPPSPSLLPSLPPSLPPFHKCLLNPLQHFFGMPT